ncbi:MAG TPA: Uma2 family endonuclease [Chthoniobacterales bacterium]
MQTLLKTGMRPVTAKAFYRLPETNQFCELIEGELVMPPSPDPSHQTIAGTIFGELCLYLRDRPLGTVYHAPLDVELSPVNVYQPEVLFVSEGRRDRVKRKRVVGAPDLVVEVLSPSTARYDQGDKLLRYARSGVVEMWLVDPEDRQVQVYRFDREDPIKPKQVLGGGDVLRTDLLPGFEMPLGRFFLMA